MTRQTFEWEGFQSGLGWYWEQTIQGAFKKADLFNRFSSSERETLSKIATQAIVQSMGKRCDSLHYLDETGAFQCVLYQGHPGPHQSDTDHPLPDDDPRSPASWAARHAASQSEPVPGITVVTPDA